MKHLFIGQLERDKTSFVRIRESPPGYCKSRCETFNYQIGLSAKEKLHGFGSKLKDLSEFALLRRKNHFCHEARINNPIGHYVLHEVLHYN